YQSIARYQGSIGDTIVQLSGSRPFGVMPSDRLHRKPAPRRIRRCNMKILMVLTSHDQLGDTGLKTGFWLEEGAAPYFVFRDAGVDITLASPKGGQPPIDPKSDMPENQTPAQVRFKKDAVALKAFANTVKLADVK